MRADERVLYERLGAVVRQLRRVRQLTQDQLAERLQLRRTSVTNIEQGAQGVTAYTLVRLADALGVSPGHLLELAVGAHGSEEDAIARAVPDASLQDWVRAIAASDPASAPTRIARLDATRR